MAADAARFEWDKFCHSLKQSGSEISNLSVISEFWDVKKCLPEKMENCDRLLAANLLPLLRKLNDAVAECRVFSLSYNDPVNVRYKNFWRFNLVNKWLFERKIRKQLRIKEEIRSLFASLGDKVVPCLSLTPSGDEEVVFDNMVAEIEKELCGLEGCSHSYGGFTAYGILGGSPAANSVLAREVFDSPDVQRYFHVRIFLCLSNSALSNHIDIDITKRLLENLDYDADLKLVGADEAGIDALLTTLRKKLSLKRFLIVLDGVRKESKFYENLPASDGESKNRLSFGLPKGEGCAVIVTGAREDLLQRMIGGRSLSTCLDDSNGKYSTSKMASTIGNVLLGRGGKEFISYGIAGMAGSGKTTLARQVFTSTSVRENFPFRIWVPLSDIDATDTDNRTKTLKYMLEQLNHDPDKFLTGADSDTNEIILLLAALKKALSGKKFLIVLDGIWQDSDWYHNLSGITHCPDKLSYALPKATDGAEGGAVLVTGMVEEHVKPAVGAGGHVTRLDQESRGLKEKCWKIFEVKLKKEFEALKIEGHLSDNLRRDVKQKIQGLPLAASTLARIIPRQIKRNLDRINRA